MRTAGTLLVALTCAAACGDEGTVLRPIVEVPPAGAEAHPLDGVDELELSIARAGDESAVALATAAPGEPLELAGVPFDDDLVVHLSGRTAGVEVAYGRTCVVDVSEAESALAVEPRLYFSRIVKWGATDGLAAARADRPHAFALPDGSAVFLGGDSTAVDVFDPLAAGTFRELEAALMPRDDAVVVSFDNGSGLVVGGTDGSGDAIPIAEVLTPGAETAERQIDEVFGPSVTDHAAVLLVDGSIVVSGGLAQPAPNMPFTATDEAWRYRVGDGGIVDVPRRLSERMLAPRHGHTMTRLGDEPGADVLLIGGQDAGDAPVAAAELYRPLRETFEPVPGAPLSRPRWGHLALRLPGGFVLVLGGYSDAGGGVAVRERLLELYDPVQGGFSPAGTLPDDAGITDLTATPLPDGRILLAGGLDVNGDPVATTLIARFDAVNGTVDLVPTDSLSTPRAGHAAVPLCDGTILIAGGSTAGAERYNPPSAFRR